MYEKGIPFTRTDIDLDAKPPWLDSLSPFGKVPVLVINDQQSLIESQAICEYLDEVSDNPLYPASPVERAKQRALIIAADEILTLLARIIYRDKTLEAVDVSLSKIKEKFGIVIAWHSGGKFFAGDEFHLVDAVYATIFRYQPVLEKCMAKNVFLESGVLRDWNVALQSRASVKNAVPENYENLLMEYMRTHTEVFSTT